jgi:hypothetical protein
MDGGGRTPSPEKQVRRNTTPRHSRRPPHDHQDGAAIIHSRVIESVTYYREIRQLERISRSTLQDSNTISLTSSRLLLLFLSSLTAAATTKDGGGRTHSPEKQARCDTAPVTLTGLSMITEPVLLSSTPDL